MQKITSFFHHLFIPSEKNNYRAKLLHIHLLTFYVLILFGFIMVYKTAATVLTDGQVLGIATNITIEELLQDTNNERVKKGLLPLAYNKKLEKAAYDKANNMFQQGYWAHYAPDGSTPWDFIRAQGYQYEYAGENLAKDFMFSNGVVHAWMASPTHRDNILREPYTEVGFAVVNGTLQGGAPTTLVVQMLGKPFENAIAYHPPQVLSGSNSPTRLNIKKISFNYSLIFLAFLILILITDLYWAYRLRLVRVTGKHLAHALFLVIIMTAFIIAAKGTIL